MQETLTTLVVLAACAATVFAAQDRIFKTLEWNSSPLDWCEKNHEYTPWIVEFWNTMSSFVLAFVGLLGYLVYNSKHAIHRFEPQFVLIWAIMVAVGLGSVWFHGTLSVAGQISDEVPIVVLAVVAIMMARPKLHWGGSSRDVALSGHTLVRASTVFMVFCLFYPVASHIFTLFCFPGCGFFFFRDYARSKDPRFKALFVTSLICFCLAFGSWIVDRVACKEVTEFGEKYLWGYPQLHAIWHVFIGMAFWMLIVLGVAMRAEVDGIKFKIENKHRFLPVIHMDV